MAQFIPFEQADRIIGAGNNPNTGDLQYALGSDPITNQHVKEGERAPGFMVSCWQLSDRELKRVIESGKVYLAIMCHPDHPIQPPVCIIGQNPFTELPRNERYEHIPKPGTLEAKEDDDPEISEVEYEMNDEQKKEAEEEIRRIVSLGGDPYDSQRLKDLEADEDFIDSIVSKINAERDEI